VTRRAEARGRFVSVVFKAFSRFEGGERTYGAFDPRTDRRDLRHEAEEEFLDAIVYAYLGILALRAGRAKTTQTTPLRALEGTPDTSDTSDTPTRARGARGGS
jgi:hypothetical protein